MPETQAVLVRLPTDLYEDLKRHAKDQDRTIAADVRRAVRRYLQGAGAGDDDRRQSDDDKS